MMQDTSSDLFHVEAGSCRSIKSIKMQKKQYLPCLSLTLPRTLLLPVCISYEHMRRNTSARGPKHPPAPCEVDQVSHQRNRTASFLHLKCLLALPRSGVLVHRPQKGATEAEAWGSATNDE